MLFLPEKNDTIKIRPIFLLVQLMSPFSFDKLKQRPIGLKLFFNACTLAKLRNEIEWDFSINWLKLGKLFLENTLVTSSWLIPCMLLRIPTKIPTLINFEIKIKQTQKQFRFFHRFCSFLQFCINIANDNKLTKT